MFIYIKLLPVDLIGDKHPIADVIICLDFNEAFQVIEGVSPPFAVIYDRITHEPCDHSEPGQQHVISPAQGYDDVFLH